jgi:hypothetical protein
VHSCVCTQLSRRLSETILKWDTPPWSLVR